MTTIINTPRLLQAAKEFNIGKETLVEFLVQKGFEVNSNPSTKLTPEMYNALQSEFAQDKAAKRKSDEIALPKGSHDNLKRTKEAETAPKTHKEEVKAADLPKVAEPAPVIKEAPKEIVPEPTKVAAHAPQLTVVGKIDVSAAVKEPPVSKEVKTGTAPQQKEQVVKKETAKEAKEKATINKVADKNNKKEESKAAEPKIPLEKAAESSPVEGKEEPETEHIETKAPKLEGPNIKGKIDLSEMNLASRPKKGFVKAPDSKKVQQTKSEKIKPALAQPSDKEQKPVVPPHADFKEQQNDAPLEEDNKDEDAGARPDHIETKIHKLEGPKIIGKIDLPVAQPNSGSGSSAQRSDRDRGEKRKRKRIPVDKKPETGRPPGERREHDNRPPGTGNTDNRGTRDNRDNRGSGIPGGGNRQQGIGRPGDRPRSAPGTGQPSQFNRPAPDNRRERQPMDRRRDMPATQQQQEIDAKIIQEKIRETQAKLSGSTRGKNQKSKYRRSKRDEMAERRAAAENAETDNLIQVTEFISVSELANMLNVTFADVISKCMSLGIMVSINQRLDAEIIELVANEFGYEVEFINLEQKESEEEEIVDDEANLQPRAPIVTIMGHVDHGKTSLLDYIRSANVVAGEAGGITQHIGAYQVTTATGKKITFLDTPGHEAFTAMRARGAKAADVAVIVIAADDAIMPQTREAISHAQAASLPMIFAINKIDKAGSNPEKIKEQLSAMNILVEDWGGTYQCQEISAKKGINIDVLLEKIVLESEMLELKANPDRIATGTVIEASLDKGRGYQTTMLVQNGTLNQGEMLVCGQYFGKIKAMFNERGQRVKSATPSTPVQVLGLNGAPQAGEKFKVYEDEVEAKEVATHRSQILREQGIRARKHITLDEIGRRLALGNFKELGIIIKGDFDGSVEALSDSLQKLSTQEVAVRVVHKAVGQITESDVLLATASDAIIIGFQVRPSLQAARLAEQENIEIRTYSIIYDAIIEIRSAMEGLLEPKVEKRAISNVEVRDIFKISGVGTIAGCYVTEGKITRNAKINLIRDGIVIFTGELASLKRFKDDAKEVATNYECGLSVKNYNDVRVGDIIEGYEEVEVKRTL